MYVSDVEQNPINYYPLILQDHGIQMYICPNQNFRPFVSRIEICRRNMPLVQEYHGIAICMCIKRKIFIQFIFIAGKRMYFISKITMKIHP